MLRYQNNAFRVLGLSSAASIQDIMQRVNEIKIKKSLGLHINYDFDFSWMGEIDRSEENVISSLQRLENPVNRLKEEIFWPWNDTDTDREAINYLIKGDRQSAHVLWKKLTISDHPDKNTTSAFLNQMVLSHSSVIGKELTIKYNDSGAGGDCKYCSKCKIVLGKELNYCIHCGSKLTLKGKETVINTVLSDSHWTNWRFAYHRISLIAAEDLFWKRIHEKAERINDPRLSSSRVDEMKEHFLCDIVNPNLRFIAQALFNKDYERTKRHASLLNGSSISYDVLRKGFNETLSSQVSLIKRHCETSHKEIAVFEKLPKKPIKQLIKIYAQLETKVDEPIKQGNLVDFNCISDFGLTRDSLAGVVKNMAIILNNLLIADKTIIGETRTSAFDKAHEMIKKANEYASTQYVKQRFAKDEEVIKNNIEMERLANNYYQHSSSTQTTTSTTTKQKAPQISRPSFNWKPIGWIVFIVVMVIVANLPNDSKNKSVSTTTSTSSTANPSTSVYQLKTQIEALEESIKNKESALKQLQSNLDSKSGTIDVLKSRIEDLENRYNKAGYGKEQIANEYNQAVNSHNEILETYQKDYISYQNLYKGYEEELKRRNNLVAEYNSRIR